VHTPSHLVMQFSTKELDGSLLYSDMRKLFLSDTYYKKPMCCRVASSLEKANSDLQHVVFSIACDEEKSIKANFP